MTRSSWKTGQWRGQDLLLISLSCTLEEGPAAVEHLATSHRISVFKQQTPEQRRHRRVESKQAAAAGKQQLDVTLMESCCCFKMIDYFFSSLLFSLYSVQRSLSLSVSLVHHFPYTCQIINYRWSLHQVYKMQFILCGTVLPSAY